MFKNKYFIFFIILIVYVSIYFHRVSISPIASSLIEDIHLTSAELGIMSGAYFLAYAFIQPFVGVLTDRFGSKNVIIIALGATSIFCLMFAFSNNFYYVLTIRILMGLSTGSFFIPAILFLSGYFAQSQFARLTGVFIGLGSAGALIATSPLSYLELLWGWRNVFIILSFLGISLLMLIILGINSHKNNVISSTDSPKFNLKQYFANVRQLFLIRNFVLVILVFFFSTGLYLTFQGLWATRFLVETIHITPQIANNIIFFLALGYFIGSPFSGFLSEKVFYSRAIPMQIGLILQVFCWGAMIVVLPYLDFSMSTLLFFLTGLCLGMIPPLVFAVVKDCVSKDMAGTALGIANPSLFLGVAVLQVVSTYIVDLSSVNSVFTAHSYKVMMLFFLLVTIIVCIISFFIKDTFIGKSKFEHIEHFFKNLVLVKIPSFKRNDISKEQFTTKKQNLTKLITKN